MSLKKSYLAVLVSLWVALGTLQVAGQQAGATTTTVSDTVLSANGSPEPGILLISWPAFTAATGQAIAAGHTSAVIGTDGHVSASLVPNAGAQPLGVSYKAVYKLSDGTSHVEYWIVPVSQTAVTIASVRAQQLPPSVAVQTVTKQYVDSAIQGAITGLTGFGGKLSRQGDTPTTLADVRYANQFPGATVGDQIDAACGDLHGVAGTVVIPASMGAGWSNAGVADGCLIQDERGKGGSSGTVFYKSFDLYGRYTQTNPGLNVLQPLLVESDAYLGGVNSASNKTQYSGIHAEFDGRTVGERKNVVGFMRCEGKGDCIGSAFWAQDWGGYGAIGDEGNEGGRFEADQTDGSTYPVPSGTVSVVSGNAISVSWANGSNAYVGEARPLINLSRGVYSTGSVTSAALSNGACTITGSGTGWASSVGAGAHQDLFLEITGNSGAHLRWTVPVLQWWTIPIW